MCYDPELDLEARWNAESSGGTIGPISFDAGRVFVQFAVEDAHIDPAIEAWSEVLVTRLIF